MCVCLPASDCLNFDFLTTTHQALSAVTYLLKIRIAAEEITEILNTLLSSEIHSALGTLPLSLSKKAWCVLI